MFSTALKSFSSNISSNYVIDSSPSSLSGPWKIYNAKKKSTGKTVSIFAFDKRSLDSNSGGLGRSGGSSLRKAQDEVVERLRKEASSLARLRHPCILELVEPVEDTRSGGLQFATEPVTTSLAVLLAEKDDQERAGGVGGRSSRYVVEDADGGRRRREVEIDELEIQKGLLQIAKGLEFLHESAGLLHGNLTPESIYVNAKSDWKLSGLGFSSPPQDSKSSSTVAPIALSEVLNYDPRLPRTVQLNLDYTSPDFVLDNNLNHSADFFSLGLLIVSLYNSPHTSPLKVNGSTSTYRRLLSSTSTTPSQNNDFLCSRKLPRDLAATVLPRLLARRPAQRLDSREFQQSQYFDNILVSTIRFLDSLPAKTPNEKAQFMRGLTRVLTQFPKSVLEKKVLPALLEEMKDRDLLSLVLQNVFKILDMLPSKERAFTEKVIPRLREIFLTTSQVPAKLGAVSERDNAKDAGSMVILDNLGTIIDSCFAKDFKDDVLPIIHQAMESSTNSLVDASLRSLPTILPVIDFSTLKNELFPVIATVFSKTSSLGIKVRGLEAFLTLCGGQTSSMDQGTDDLNGIISNKNPSTRPNTNAALDKYTIQEKVMPLMKAIKTKEPAVMIAALNVFKQIGAVVDADFIALEVLPILWGMSLGPLLNLDQFQQFMTLIKSLSSRVERDQARKLKELSSTNDVSSRNDRGEDFMSFGALTPSNLGTNGAEDDFEQLVLGNNRVTKKSPPVSNGWENTVSNSSTSSIKSPNPQSDATMFSWSTPTPSIGQAVGGSRTITPDLTAFTPLAPASNIPRGGQMGQSLAPSSSFTPLQPNVRPINMYNNAFPPPNYTQNTWTSPNSSTSLPGFPQQGTFGQSHGFGISPPPQSSNYNAFPTQPARNQWNIAPPPPSSQQQPAFGNGAPASQQQAKKSGLDSYQSLL
ncbi:MAG: hypothetical protein M1814_004074 [Vezdaea aestivalis]|nr:MAG: hypothetical protein M1814_004074 [Vezdaea aestivalis]